MFLEIKVTKTSQPGRGVLLTVSCAVPAISSIWCRSRNSPHRDMPLPRHKLANFMDTISTKLYRKGRALQSGTKGRYSKMAKSFQKVSKKFTKPTWLLQLCSIYWLKRKSKMEIHLLFPGGLTGLTGSNEIREAKGVICFSSWIFSRMGRWIPQQIFRKPSTTTSPPSCCLRIKQTNNSIRHYFKDKDQNAT